MTNPVLLALASAVLITATPVLANDPVAPSASAAQSDAAPAQVKAKAKETKYCVVEKLTGSRVDTKVCLTRKEWLARDYDPLKGDQ
ncbi:MAG: hypothetical protein V4564_03895 [Pseudomonadota bacterium]|uniref:hypothetical protein n=1 Tax=Sphingomonas sp. ERG5 TaxID=1381597 RepID=UPI00054C7F1D|nr:hypothetical protein [Sphingomonas sp. ERG5]